MCIEKAAQQTMINVYRARAPLYEIVNGRQRMLTVSHTLVTKVPGVLRRDAMVARHFAVVVCPSVRPSQAGIVSRRLDESSRFWHGDILPPIAHCYQEIWVSPKDRVLPCGTLSQTPDSENIAAASRSRCQQNSSTVELVDDTNTTIDESWLFTTSRSTVTL